MARADPPEGLLRRAVCVCSVLVGLSFGRSESACCSCFLYVLRGKPSRLASDHTSSRFPGLSSIQERGQISSSDKREEEPSARREGSSAKHTRAKNSTNDHSSLREFYQIHSKTLPATSTHHNKDDLDTFLRVRRHTTPNSKKTQTDRHIDSHRQSYNRQMMMMMARRGLVMRKLGD